MANRLRLIEKFTKLVTVDSLSYQEREMADILIKELKNLGFDVKEDEAGKLYSGNAGNIYGYLPGELPGDPILFSAHMDTVGPGKNKKAVVHEDGLITSDGSTVLGADDLSGIVSILEAIRTIQEEKKPHRSIEVLFTIAEEVYLRGSEIYDFSIIKAKEAYVLDLSGPVGTAALQAPTVLSFTAMLHGRAAHAGFAPEQGINAIAMAAEAITQIKQGRIDDDTTVNIGLIEGGKARNIVSDECILKGEVRSLSHEKAVFVTKEIENIFYQITSAYKGGIGFTTDIGCLAYEVSADHPVVKKYEEVCKALGYEYNFITTFGGSDNNNFLRHGITGIVMACGMNKVHSCSEYTHVDELIKCTNIVYKLMTQ